MMKRSLIAAFAVATLAGPALASGDAAKGEADFKKCKACHMIVDDAGNEIVKGGKTGPNLWGVVGRAPGTVEGFKYGDSIIAVGASGVVWDEDNLEDYLKDPTAWLKETSGDAGAKSKMTFKLPKGAEDMAAYLATLK